MISAVRGSTIRRSARALRAFEELGRKGAALPDRHDFHLQSRRVPCGPRTADPRTTDPLPTAAPRPPADVIVVNDASRLRRRPLHAAAQAFADFSSEVLPVG